MNSLKALLKDIKSYDFFSIFTSPSLWGVVNYRISSFFWNTKLLHPLYYLYFPVWRIVSLLLGIEIYGKTQIQEKLQICHYGGIFINPRCKIGRNCVIYNNVSIGNAKFGDIKCPTIGDNVRIGVGAKVLGDIVIGNNVDIGANALVIHSIPANSVVGGNPAKIIKKKNEEKKT